MEFCHLHETQKSSGSSTGVRSVMKVPGRAFYCASSNALQQGSKRLCPRTVQLKPSQSVETFDVL